MNYQGFRDELIEVMVAEMRRGKRPRIELKPGTFRVFRRKSEHDKGAKLTETQVYEIRDLGHERVSFAEIGRRYGISYQYAAGIVKREQRRDLPELPYVRRI